MGSTEGSSVSPDSCGLDYGQAGPTALRLALGAQLRRLREARGITRGAAGEVLEVSDSRIKGLESGRTACRPCEVTALLAFYGVDDDSERGTLLALAEQSNAPGWWQPYSDVVPAGLQAYLDLEHSADVIRSYEAQGIPDLLQTPDYARAVIRFGHRGIAADASEAEVERRVGLRMKRQQILRRPNPPHVWAVIDESALRRTVGSTDTTLTQLEHLIDASEHPHITIQMVPFRADAVVGEDGPVTILRLPGGELPDVVCLEPPTGARYPCEPADIEHYRHIMNQLVIEADSPAVTRTALHQMLEDILSGASSP
jgi:transcriptional regulator with XRE-family HTH domain